MKKFKIGIPTGLYGDRFGVHKNYIEWVAQFGQPILLTPYIDQYELFDVLFLPGGSDVAAGKTFMTERSNPHLEWFDSYVPRCMDDNKPIFAVCRGMQALNVMDGGTLRNLYGKELRKHLHNSDELDKEDLVNMLQLPHRIRNEYHKKLPTFVDVNSIHHQAIENLGKNYEVLYLCDDVIEAIAHRTKPVIGVQWHPEKINDKLSCILFKKLLNSE